MMWVEVFVVVCLFSIHSSTSPEYLINFWCAMRSWELMAIATHFMRESVIVHLPANAWGSVSQSVEHAADVHNLCQVVQSVKLSRHEMRWVFVRTEEVWAIGSMRVICTWKLYTLKIGDSLCSVRTQSLTCERSTQRGRVSATGSRYDKHYCTLIC